MSHVRTCRGVLATLLALSLAAAAAIADEKATRRQQLLQQLETIQNELKALDAETGQAPPEGRPPEPTAAEAASEEKSTRLEALEISGDALGAPPVGRALSRIEREDIKFTRAFSINELIEEVPGVFSKQGNGPRDVNISIRGSGAKVGFGVRNIKVYEDGFPVTQSDGLSRTDITDPHAYEGVDIIRGPSSSRYDNYALGGVVNYRLRRGRDIDGFEIGNDVGSFGYHNHYVTLGGQRGGFEYSLFGSDVEADGFLRHSDFRAVTENVLLTYAPDPTRSFTFKFINNDTTTNVPSRLSLNQFTADPRSAGTVSLSVAGGASKTVTAEQAAQNREDRRTIAGGRYTQQLGESTVASLTGVFDLKDINQTFGTIGDNENPNFNVMLDVTHERALWGLPAKHYAGLFFNYMEQEASSFFNLGDGRGTRGALQSGTRGHHQNVGGRLREEVAFSPQWAGVVGIGGEYSTVRAQVRNRSAAEKFTVIEVDRDFGNVAPEAALLYRPTEDVTAHLRVGTGYGIPGISNLTTASTGLAGNNTDLKAQRNVGVELGIDTRRWLGILDLSLTGYYEWFTDEFVTLSPGAGLSSFTTNAPASEHRGIELSATLWPLAGDPLGRGLYLRTSYTFNDHVYTDFHEVIGGVRFDRSGKLIPGVERHFLNAKLGYESPWHLGGWLEVNYLDDYFVNNSNTLSAPAYHVLNLNLHYARAIGSSFLRGIETFFEVRNLLDATYVESAVTVADDVLNTAASLANKQAFFAGPSRSFYGGVRLRF